MEVVFASQLRCPRTGPGAGGHLGTESSAFVAKSILNANASHLRNEGISEDKTSHEELSVPGTGAHLCGSHTPEPESTGGLAASLVQP